VWVEVEMNVVLRVDVLALGRWVVVKVIGPEKFMSFSDSVPEE